MIPVSTTEHPPLEFERGVEKRLVKAPSAKIGWLQGVVDTPGASFDLVIRDMLGREKFRRNGCVAEGERFGELLNIETMLGEDMEVSVENLKGASKLALFLN